MSVQVRDPLGVVKTLSATTGPNGAANVNYPVAPTSALGHYTVTSTAMQRSASGSAATSFAVKYREARAGRPWEHAADRAGTGALRAAP